ncbi:hypothetical protein DTO212C5_6678 [Paecilomyces variotii]|nr:hypothetical protein DTO212C5_6678 [Paecilomyces variotii]
MSSENGDDVDDRPSAPAKELTAQKTGHEGDQEQGLLSFETLNPAGILKIPQKAAQKGAEFLFTSTTDQSAESSASEDEDSLEPALSDRYLKTDPAFNPNEVAHGRLPGAPKVTTPGLRGSSNRIGNSAKRKVAAIAHPKRAAKQRFQSKTAVKLSKATRPYISKESDREYLEAHDELFKAEADRKQGKEERERRRSGGSWVSLNQDECRKSEIDGTETGSVREGNACTIQRRKLEKLEAHRESLAIAWITGRHIKRVRVAPTHVVGYPRWDDEEFLEKDEAGNVVRFKWERYIGKLLLYHSQPFTARYVDDTLHELDFDTEILAYYIERLVMATEPWQQWAMEMRRLYRWENPKKTGKWFAVFLLLWYTEHIVGFCHMYVIYIVLKSRYFPSTAESVRESLDRSINKSEQALRWGEIVDRHGREKWIEPLLDEVAPFIQLQVGDIADFFEILRNFYRWRNPSKTAATLFFFASCATVSLFADTAFCMKIFWLVAILMFFVSFPVSSRWPQYRIVVSPLRWPVWDIPTNAEWAIQYLQKHEILRREQVAELDGQAPSAAAPESGLPENPDDSAADYLDAIEMSQQESDSNDAENETTDSMGNSRRDIISFHAYRGGHTGYLLISSNGLRFTQTRPLTLHPKKHRQHKIWSYPFSSLLEMSKIHSDNKSRLTRLDPNLAALSLVFLSDVAPTYTQKSDDEGDIASGARSEKNVSVEILDMDKATRDEVFNLIIGRSKIRWRAFTDCDQGRHKESAKKKRPHFRRQI